MSGEYLRGGIISGKCLGYVRYQKCLRDSVIGAMSGDYLDYPDYHAGLQVSVFVAVMTYVTLVNTQTHTWTVFYWLWY